jgi:hypothetical protein
MDAMKAKKTQDGRKQQSILFCSKQMIDSGLLASGFGFPRVLCQDVLLLLYGCLSEQSMAIDLEKF